MVDDQGQVAVVAPLGVSRLRREAGHRGGPGPVRWPRRVRSPGRECTTTLAVRYVNAPFGGRGGAAVWKRGSDGATMCFGRILTHGVCGDLLSSTDGAAVEPRTGLPKD